MTLPNGLLRLWASSHELGPASESNPKQTSITGSHRAGSMAVQPSESNASHITRHRGTSLAATVDRPRPEGRVNDHKRPALQAYAPLWGPRTRSGASRRRPVGLRRCAAWHQNDGQGAVLLTLRGFRCAPKGARNRPLRRGLSKRARSTAAHQPCHPTSGPGASTMEHSPELSFPFSTLIRQGATYSGRYLTHLRASSGFLNLSTLCSPHRTPGLFHPSGTHGVLTSQRVSPTGRRTPLG